eukprot:COSAG06_NODE_13606_length_1240_cov_1.063979_1_plen_273_part_01
MLSTSSDAVYTRVRVPTKYKSQALLLYTKYSNLRCRHGMQRAARPCMDPRPPWCPKGCAGVRTLITVAMRQRGRFVRRAFCTFCCAASLLLHGGGAAAAALLQPPLVDIAAPAEAFFSAATAEPRGPDPANLISNETLTLGRGAAELAVTLASAALRALAAGPRQSVAAELARRLLELDDRGHLAEAFARPAVSAALARELRGVRCTSSERISTARTAESPHQRRRQQPRDRAAGDGSVGGDAAGPDGRSSPPDRSVQHAPAGGPSVWRASGS